MKITGEAVQYADGTSSVVLDCGDRRIHIEAPTLSRVTGQDVATDIFGDWHGEPRVRIASLTAALAWLTEEATHGN